MALNPVDRSEFEGYIHRHEADTFAHAPMRHDFRNEVLGDALRMESRLSALERWQQRIVGALGMLSLLILGGGLAIVIGFLR